MNSYIIPVHSFVDLITNSSTQIYVAADDGTIKGIKDLINNVLKLAGSKQTADELFDIAVTLRVDATIDGKYKAVYLTEDEIKAGVERGEFDEDDVNRGNEYDMVNNHVRVIPKNDTPELVAICKTLSNLTGLYNIDAMRDG